MDLAVLSFTFADPDYYRPMQQFADPSPQLRPSQPPPAGWRPARREVWTIWEPPPPRSTPEQGWKVHVSASLPRAGHVLDTVAAVAFARGLPFKHLASEYMFVYTHHKHGARPQSGKFCVVYPPDQATAGELLAELSQLLAGEQGPYILSDRRYRDSRCVHYRYGAFRPLSRVRPDGTTEPLIRDATGTLVEDVRTVRFMLPAGISDPFQDPTAPQPAETAPDGGVRIGDYQVLATLAQSNAGGGYRARTPAGRPVFLKEARAHHGLYWNRSTAQQRLRREYEVLCELHERAPGLAPEPVDYFREWEHEFLVTELVPGQPLLSYAASDNPYLQASDDRQFAEYFETCRGYLAALAAALRRLHQLGYVFGDLNPRNVLVTPDGGLRLIDFEACRRESDPPFRVGVPGYVPTRPQDWAGTGPDDYGQSAVALSLLLPYHPFAQRHPAGLRHLAAELAEPVPVPDDLWELATRNFPGYREVPGAGVPEPAQVAADPLRWLRELREAVAREVVATADPDDPERVWPTAPAGHRTNPWAVAYGAAGVVHALHHCGVPEAAQLAARVTSQLREAALAKQVELPPGLHFGTAGIGWVLAERGQLDDAATLVNAAADHPLTAADATWGAGSAGVGTALLAVFAGTGDERHLTRAVKLGEQLCGTADLTELIGPHDATGLLHGRVGVALFLHQLWRATGEHRFLRHGTGLLHHELDRAVPMRGGELGFRDNRRRRRIMAYLTVGSAGAAMVLTRYAASGGDPRLTAALPGVLGYAGRRLTLEAGLYQGLAGLAFAHAEHASHAAAGDPVAAERAVTLATGLFKYASPGPDRRVRFPGTANQRFCSELYSGAAGVLLALSRVLDGPRGQFFTLDHGVPISSTEGGGTP